MANPSAAITRSSPDVVGLVISAIGGETPSLSGMLEYLAKAFDAFGCVLWECLPDDETRPDDLEASHLFVLASHFAERHLFSVHDLPVTKSRTGKALLQQKTMSTQDVQNDDEVQHKDPVLARLWIGPMVTAPITFLDGTRGAVNLYRKQGEKPFDEQDEEQLTSLARSVPSLYQAIRDKVSLDLLNDVNGLLASSHEVLHGLITPADDMYQRLKQVVRRVAETFHSLEVSVFLENPLESPGHYKCVATTWPKRQELKTYTKDPKDGMTGWALYHGKPVLIFDFEKLRNDQPLYPRRVPGVVWKDDLKIVDTARKELRLEPEDTLPPLGYVATPIIVDNKVAGVIRSTAGQLGEPYYYNNRDLKLLQLVAAQISRYWGTWLHGREIVAAKETWEARTFEDLEHQVRGPLNQVQRRVEWLTEEFGHDNRKLAAVRGLCRKAVRATRSIGVLAKLADDKPLPLTLEPLNHSSLVTLLIELAEDNQVLVGPRRGIRFEVNRDSFPVTQSGKVAVDRVLFEQALNNVLDNAGKYSFRNTVVRIFGGLTTSGNYHITVANTGIRIRSDEVQLCVARGWRTDDACSVADEGSGIGLWIVDKIMKAHRGHLEIIPTNKDRETHVKLVFPITYVRS